MIPALHFVTKTPPERPFWGGRLILESCSKGYALTAVDDDGTAILSGNLLIFNTDGTITLSISVNPKLGFSLKEDGKIKVANP